jgi:ABC-type transporter Mla subunit MlaD
MPQGRGLYLRVGGLVLAGFVLLVGFVLFFTANRFGSGAVVFETYLRESVQGLDVGSPVRYRGVAIGRVSEVGLVSAEYRPAQGDMFGPSFQLVFVRFTVDTSRIGEVPPTEEAVRLGLRVRIAAQGITGVNYLELDFVAPGRFPPREVPWEPRYEYIPAIPSTVAQVQGAAEQLLEKLQAADLPGLLDNIIGLTSDVRGQLRDGDLAVSFREAALLLRRLREVSEAAQVPEALAELRGAVGETRALIGDARGLVEGREMRQLLTSAAAAAADFRAAAARLPPTIASAEAGIRSARGATTDIQAELAPILRDLRAAVANLRDTTEALRRAPSQAIFGAPPPAPETRR